MRQARQVRVALLSCATLVLIGWSVWPRDQEPVQDGKKLSEWLLLYRDPLDDKSSEHSRDAENSVLRIGTNALPFLVKWIGYRSPHWKVPVYGPVFRASPGLQRRKSFVWLIARGELRARLAAWGFEVLGEAARPAIPELARLVNERRGDEPCAIYALACVGQDAILPLLGIATNRALPTFERIMAVDAVAGQRDVRRCVVDYREPAVMMLMELTKDATLGGAATNALRHFAPGWESIEDFKAAR